MLCLRTFSRSLQAYHIVMRSISISVRYLIDEFDLFLYPTTKIFFCIIVFPLLNELYVSSLHRCSLCENICLLSEPTVPDDWVWGQCWASAGLAEQHGGQSSGEQRSTARSSRQETGAQQTAGIMEPKVLLLVWLHCVLFWNQLMTESPHCFFTLLLLFPETLRLTMCLYPVCSHSLNNTFCIASPL